MPGPEYEPDYVRLANAIRNKIRTGVLSAGDKIPTKAELMAEYEVAAGTVDTAMVLLRSEGYVVGRQGKGRFVAEGKDDLRPPD
jgi:DNA-binding GntR family transcriptional regulator